jgi:hypothetical protein
VPEQPRRPGPRRRAAGRCSAGARGDRARGRRTIAAPLTMTSAHGRAGDRREGERIECRAGRARRRLEGARRLAAGEPAMGQRLLDVDPQSPGVRAASSRSGVRAWRFQVAWATSNRSGSSARRSVSRWLRPLTVTPAEADRPSSGRLNPRARSASGLPRASARIRSRTRSSSDRSSRSCRDRAARPSARPQARPLGRSRIVVEGSPGAGQPELMFPCLEFSDVCRCRDGGPLRRVSVHTDRNLAMTSRRVPDVGSPSDNARAAGRSIA